MSTLEHPRTAATHEVANQATPLEDYNTFTSDRVLTERIQKSLRRPISNLRVVGSEVVGGDGPDQRLRECSERAPRTLVAGVQGGGSPLSTPAAGASFERVAVGAAKGRALGLDGRVKPARGDGGPGEPRRPRRARRAKSRPPWRSRPRRTCRRRRPHRTTPASTSCWEALRKTSRRRGRPWRGSAGRRSRSLRRPAPRPRRPGPLRSRRGQSARERRRRCAREPPPLRASVRCVGR